MTQDKIIWKPQPGSQEAFLQSSSIYEVLYHGTRGGGKSVADFTPILTSLGWKRADEVTLNDKLIAPDGSTTNLLGIYPQPKEDHLYKLTLDNNQEIRASGDHRWRTRPMNETLWAVKTTEEILYSRQPHSLPLMATDKTRLIKSIEKTNWQPTRCFAVDHPSHCFVIDDYVVTHNTDALIMSFAMFVGRGFGPAWKGVLFRQEYKQLEDVISKSKKWFYQIFPTAKYNNSENVWNFPDGERLLLRNFDKPDDYWKFHGHEYPWIGWEELTNWASDEGYKSMMSCSRSTLKGMPRMVRATTNPYGVGHNWIKARFLPDTQNMKVRANLIENGRPSPPRLSIFSNLNENKIMLENDPDYVHRIAAAARNDAERKAWLEGSWDVVSGGMFDDVWETKYNVIKPFAIPKSWIIDRSFDWGSSHPFSVGWWATSDGSDVQLPNGSWKSTVRGDMFRISEWYGCTGKPNEGLRMMATDISKGIVERELSMGFRDQQNPNWCRVQTGVADSQIFAAENGNCIATDMSCRVRLDSGIVYPGISWHSADKRPGSRKTGWAQMRQMINNAKPSELGYRENPGLFVFDTCTDFIRTIPVLPRDKKDMDDIDTAAEDHIADETRYAVRFKGIVGKTMTVIGAY